MKGQINLFDELIIDSFAGGGGASTGIELAVGRPADIAINHDPAAIAMHKVNHPFTKHYCESVWEVNPKEATQGRPVALAWFSPDCKHFSKAKGGKPVDNTIRGLAWAAVKWAATVKPRVIILENVEEFKTWGPVINGQPDKKQSGKTFKSFVNALRRLGYTVDWRELKACDYGAPTIRKRFFLIARRDGRPIVWPEPTHGKPDSEEVRSGLLKPWRTAAEIIDWSLPCPSIFDTAEEIYIKYGVRAVRPLAEATMRRIARGIKKFVIDSPEPFIVNVNHTANNNHFHGQSICEPIGTLTAKNSYSFVTPTLIQYHGEQSNNEVRCQSLENPLLTVDAAGRYGLVAAFMSKYYDGGHSGCGNSVGEQLNTITSVDHNALVTASLTMFNQCSIGSELSEPMNTVMAGATRFGLMASHLIKLKGDNTGQPVGEPLQTITAGGNHFGEARAFLMKYYGQGVGQNADEPVHTIAGKDTFGLVTISGEKYYIADIGLRMLTPRELFNAQGFPTDYIIDCDADGNPYPKSEQVARCGNSVPPPFAEALVRVNLPELCGKTFKSMDELKNEIAI